MGLVRSGSFVGFGSFGLIRLGWFVRGASIGLVVLDWFSGVGSFRMVGSVGFTWVSSFRLGCLDYFNSVCLFGLVHSRCFVCLISLSLFGFGLVRLVWSMWVRSGYFVEVSSFGFVRFS